MNRNQIIKKFFLVLLLLKCIESMPKHLKESASKTVDQKPSFLKFLMELLEKKISDQKLNQNLLSILNF